MTLTQLIETYNLFCERVTPEFMQALLDNSDKLSVATIEMTKLFQIAMDTGEPPTTRDFIASREVIGF